MLDEKAFERAVGEIESLNRNLSTYGPSVQKISLELEKLNKNIEVVKAVGKQIWLLNQILMQVKKSQGNVAMVKQLFEAAGGAIFGKRRP